MGMATGSNGKSKGSAEDALSDCHIHGIIIHASKVIALKDTAPGL